MKAFLLHTNNNNLSAAITRVVLGTVLFAHGAQKLFGWFGGYGFKGTMSFLTETAGLPWIIGFLVIIIEFFGSLSIIFGFATRLWSIAIAILTIGIIETSHISFGFFMNWFGNQKGEGIEFFLLMLAMAITLIISGGGSFSIDAVLSGHTKSKQIPVSKAGAVLA